MHQLHLLVDLDEVGSVFKAEAQFCCKLHPQPASLAQSGRLLLLAEAFSNLLESVTKTVRCFIPIAAILRIDPPNELLVELVPLCLDDKKGEKAHYKAKVTAYLSQDLVIRDYGHFSLKNARVLSEDELVDAA